MHMYYCASDMGIMLNLFQYLIHSSQCCISDIKMRPTMHDSMWGVLCVCVPTAYRFASLMMLLQQVDCPNTHLHHCESIKKIKIWTHCSLQSFYNVYMVGCLNILHTLTVFDWRTCGQISSVSSEDCWYSPHHHWYNHSIIVHTRQPKYQTFYRAWIVVDHAMHTNCLQHTHLNTGMSLIFIERGNKHPIHSQDIMSSVLTRPLNLLCGVHACVCVH